MPQYRGASHLHTTYSYDGALPVPALARLLEEKGIQFALLSEHIEELTREKIEAVIGECRRLSNDRFLMIPGIEIDAFHVLLFGIKSVPPLGDDVETIRALRAQGAIAVLSHPIKLKRGIPGLVRPMLEGVEVWNTRYDGKGLPNPAHIRLWRQLRRETPGLFAICGLDFHSRSDYTDAWFEVESEAFTEEAILAGLRQGRVTIHKRGRQLPLSDGVPALQRKFFLFRAGIHQMFYRALLLSWRLYKKLRLPLPASWKSRARRNF